MGSGAEGPISDLRFPTSLKHMKSYFSYLVLALCMALVACEEKQVIYSGPDYVRFTDTTLVYKESIGQTVAVKVHLVGKPNDSPVTVTYSITGTAVAGRDYQIEGTKGVVTIPAGQHFGTIDFKLLNNANNILRSSEILLTLNSASQGEQRVQIGTGKNFSLGNSLRLTIEDDCLFGGFYNAKRVGSNILVKDVAITSTNCTEYLLSNWNVGLMSFNADKLSLRFVDNGDNSLSVPNQYNLTLGDTVLGKGAWDPRTRQIVLNLVIKTTGNSGADTLITIPQLTYVPR